MNHIAYASAYSNERTERTNRVDRSVNRHLSRCRMQNRVAVGILGSTTLLVIFGLLLLILPAFRVQSINVKGLDSLNRDQVIEASGISIGDEILNLKPGEIAERIAQAEGVESVSVSTSLGGVTIKIVEKDSGAISNSANADGR